jgi:hypothetical protein
MLPPWQWQSATQQQRRTQTMEPHESYSEKIMSGPCHSMNDDHSTVHSLSAPTSYSIHEHSTTQQRQQLNIAQKTSLLRQQIWEEFELLSPNEQTNSLERAKVVQNEFLWSGKGCVDAKFGWGSSEVGSCL